MVVHAPPRLALLRPVADVTVGDGLRIGAGQRVGRQVRFEPAARPCGSRPRSRPPGTSPARPSGRAPGACAPESALHVRQQVRVERDLQHRARLRLAGQLRVHDLVGPVPEIAANRYAEQKVGLPEPVSVEQDTLEDHVRARLHRGARRLGAGCPASSRGDPGLRLGDLDHRAETVPQLRQEPRLVLQTAAAQHLRARVVEHARLRALAKRHRPRDTRQVRASEVVAEVRRSEDEPVSDRMHDTSGWSWRVGGATTRGQLGSGGAALVRRRYQVREAVTTSRAFP